MPNGYEQERDAVWKQSRLWGTVWQTGDTLYYLGIVGSVVIPLSLLAIAVVKFESWDALLKSAGIALCFFIGCLPIGLGTSLGLKWLARNRTGVDGH